MYLHSFAAVIGNHVYQQLEDWQIEKKKYFCQKEKALLLEEYMLVVWFYSKLFFENESTISLH